MLQRMPVGDAEEQRASALALLLSQVFLDHPPYRIVLVISGSHNESGVVLEEHLFVIDGLR
jgi:hypothetical protein